ncbi:unnamed protein product [Chrysoparadoxa australica]
MSELSPHLDPGLVVWGALRCLAPDGGSGVKFVRLAWVGEEVGGMAKGKAGMHKNSIFGAMDGAVGEVSATSAEELPGLLEEVGKVTGGWVFPV